MKGHARFFFLILICILTVFSVEIAAAEADGTKPFSTDYEAINEAAQSMFLVEIYGANDTLLGTGSGFIAFDEHYFVTNHHVIDDAKYLIVIDDNGKEYKVTDLLVADEEKDIAILSFDEAANYRPLPLCTTDDLLRGQPIVAIGSPKGVRNTVTTGNISNLIDDNGTHIIQFTAAASPGSSGGAIFNDVGEIIGLMYSKLQNAENMNYAINIKEVINLKYSDYSLFSLSEYNATPDSILILPDSQTIKITHNWKTKKYDVRLQIQNTDKTRSITSFTLQYGFVTSSKEETVWTKNVKKKIFPEKTITTTISIDYYDFNSPYMHIGIKNVIFDNGIELQCEDDLKYHAFKVYYSDDDYKYHEWIEQLMKEQKNK